MLGGDQELPDKLVQGKRYYAEFQQPGETWPMGKIGLPGFYSAIISELNEEEEDFLEAVSDPAGYDNPQELVKSVRQQLTESYNQIVDRLPAYWSDHPGQE